MERSFVWGCHGVVMLVAPETERVVGAVHAALGRRGTVMPRVVAFDLDGTLVVDRPRALRDLPAPPAVRPEIAAVAVRLLEEGHTLLVVTGRETEAEARRDTHRALAAALDGPPDPAMGRRIIIASGGTWLGTRTAVRRKVEALRRYAAAVFVGDLEHLDGRAAREVGIPFVDVKAAKR